MVNYFERCKKRIEDADPSIIKYDSRWSQYTVGDLRLESYTRPTVEFRSIEVPLNGEEISTLFGLVHKKYSDYRNQEDKKILEEL